MADKILLSKRNLYLVAVMEPKPYGNKTPQKTLLPFTAKDLSLEHGTALVDKPLRFVAFHESLQTFVKGLAPNAIFSVDYEEKAREDNPDYPPDRTIVQIYKADGSPVYVDQNRGGGFQGKGGGGSYGRTPESVRLEYSLKAQIENMTRVSIEGQTAVAQAGALILAIAQGAKAEGIGIDLVAFKRIETKYWQAVEKGLDALIAAKPLVITTPPAAAPAGSSAPAQVKAPAWPALKNAGELMTRAAKYKIPSNETLAIIGVKQATEIKNFDIAWAKIATEKKIAPPAGTDDPDWDKLSRDGKN